MENFFCRKAMRLCKFHIASIVSRKGVLIYGNMAILLQLRQEEHFNLHFSRNRRFNHLNPLILR